MSVYLFPFEQVSQGARVVLYGAGVVGKSYFEQMQLSGYAEIVAVVDKDYQNKAWGNFQSYLRSPLVLKDIQYDFIIICITDETIALNIKQGLLQQNIADNKIVFLSDRKLDMYQRTWYFEKGEVLFPGDATPLFALRLTGSFGDYIVTMKIVQVFVDIIPNLIIDIYCPLKKMGFAKSVFMQHPNIRNFYDECKYFVYAEFYRMAFTVTHFLTIDFCDDDFLKLNYNQFFHQVNTLRKEYDDYCSGLDGGFYSFFVRCKILGLDRYTALGHNGIFSIKDKQVKIFFDEKYCLEFNKLGLKRYITVNYGVDVILVKIWPKEYFEKLIILLKGYYPGVSIIQLGAKDAEHLAGVDRYILGESLELSKYILKNSMLHIDCEGGLVHLATQLGTKCLVLGGPTPMWYYGYEQNINIISDFCRECDGIFPYWEKKCIRGYERPECMYAITPNKVFKKADEYLSFILDSDV